MSSEPDLDGAAESDADEADAPPPPSSPRPRPRLLLELVRRVVRRASRACRCTAWSDILLCRCRPSDRKSLFNLIALDASWHAACAELLWAHLNLRDPVLPALEGPRGELYASFVRHAVIGVSEDNVGRAAEALKRCRGLRTVSFARTFRASPGAWTIILDGLRASNVPHLFNDHVPDAAAAGMLRNWPHLASLSVAAPKTDDGAALLLPAIPPGLRTLQLQDNRERPLCLDDLETLFSLRDPGALEGLRLANLHAAQSDDAPAALAPATTRLVRLEIDRATTSLRNFMWLPSFPSSSLRVLHLKSVDLLSAHDAFCTLLAHNPALEDLALDSCWFPRDPGAVSRLRSSAPTSLLRLAFLEAAGTHASVPLAFLLPQTRLEKLAAKPGFFRWFPRPPPAGLSRLREVELRRVGKELGTTSWEAVGDALLSLPGLEVIRVMVVYEAMAGMVRRLRAERGGLVVAEVLA